MTDTKLPGHEHCEYTDVDVPQLNVYWRSLDRFIDSMNVRILATEPELDEIVAVHGATSVPVQAYLHVVLGAIAEVERVAGTRDCVMNEIMNRAYAENAQR